MKHKDESIETLRGIAVILMVAGHVIGHNDSAGMKVDDDSIFRYFYYALQYLRMPLFTVISGYVYALGPLSKDSGFFRFLKGKARRLLIPMATVGTVQYLLRAVVPGINKSVDVHDIWYIYIFGFDQFWFLQSMFLVFITIAIIDFFAFINSFRVWLTVFLGAVGVRLLIPEFSFNIFSVNGYFQLLPFFILGYGLKFYSTQLFKKNLIAIFFVCFLSFYSIQQVQWFNPFINNLFLLEILTVGVGVTGIVLIFRYRFKQTILAKVGYYAFGIYLFHVFGAVGSRVRLESIVPQASPMLVFFVSLLFGVLVPILIESILMKNKLTKVVFIGASSKNKHMVKRLELEGMHENFSPRA